MQLNFFCYKSIIEILYTFLEKQEKEVIIMEITREIVEYIRKNNISAAEISENKKVDLDLLLGNTDRKMNATEMLEICSYLGIDPLSFL